MSVALKRISSLTEGNEYIIGTRVRNLRRFRAEDIEDPEGWTDLVSLVESDAHSNVCLTATKKAVRACVSASTHQVSIEFAESLNYVLENGAFQSSETLLTLFRYDAGITSAITSLIDGKLYLLITYTTDEDHLLRDLYVDTTGEGHNFTYRALAFSYALEDGYGHLTPTIPGAGIMKLSNGALCIVGQYLMKRPSAHTITPMTYTCASFDDGYTWGQYRKYSGGYSTFSDGTGGNVIEFGDGTVLYKAYEDRFQYTNVATLLSEKETLAGTPADMLSIMDNYPQNFCKFRNAIFAYVSMAAATSDGAIYRYSGNPVVLANISEFVTAANWTFELAAETGGYCIMQEFDRDLIISSNKTLLVYRGRAIPQRVRKASYKNSEGDWKRVIV